MVGISAIYKLLTHLNTFVGPTAQEMLKHRLPMFLNLSLEDERRWDRLETKLNPNELKLIYQLLKKMKDYERNHFRYVVVGIPEDEEVVKKIIIKNDCAIDFLKMLAKRIDDDGVNQVRKELYLTGTLIKNPLAQKIIAKWKKDVQWFRKNILKPLGSADLAGLENKLSPLNIATTENIQKARKFVQALNTETAKKPKNRGFFGEFWWFFGK
jgi:hypothetical protein